MILNLNLLAYLQIPNNFIPRLGVRSKLIKLRHSHWPYMLQNWYHFLPDKFLITIKWGQEYWILGSKMIWLGLCIIIYFILFWRLFIVTDGGRIRTMYRRPGQSDVVFPTGWDSATFRDKGTEIPSLSQDKGTGRDFDSLSHPVLGRPAG